MTAPVFLAPRAELGGEAVTLSGPEGRHAATVRRLSLGEEVVVVSGDGLAVQGVVSGVGRDTVTVAVQRRWEQPEPNPRLVVVQALAKGDRAERAVEMLTEVGVDEIVPWAAARCVVQWSGERGQRALERWRSTAREAGKQARRVRLPRVTELASTAEVAARLAAAAVPVVLHESASRALDMRKCSQAGEIVVVVGPEGGIGDEELAVLGVAPVRLGPTVLRTSTAGVVAAAALLAGTARWQAEDRATERSGPQR